MAVGSDVVLDGSDGGDVVVIVGYLSNTGDGQDSRQMRFQIWTNALT